jgi:glycosyltransferase involved in cell wall biosynthesis
VTRPAGDVHVVHLTSYGAPHAHVGSFIPMVRAARTAVESRPWSFEAVFGEGAEAHPWYRELGSEGMERRLAPGLDPMHGAAWIVHSLGGRTGRVILHTHFSQWDVAAALAARRRPQTTVVWHLHTALRTEVVTRVRNLVRFGVIGRLVDRILCVGPEVRERALARLAPPRRTRLFPNAIDTDHYLPAPGAERVAARRELGLDPSAPLVLFFGKDWAPKGGPILLDALARLRAGGRDVRALIVGSREPIGAAAGRLGLAGAVTVSEGLADARVMFAAADMFVSAGVAEGMPFSVLEALSGGVPVVASDIASHRFLAERVPGCAIADRRADSIAEAIGTVLDRSPADSAELAVASRRAVEGQFSLPGWGERLLGVYQELVGDRR